MTLISDCYQFIHISASDRLSGFRELSMGFASMWTIDDSCSIGMDNKNWQNTKSKASHQVAMERKTVVSLDKDFALMWTICCRSLINGFIFGNRNPLLL